MICVNRSYYKVRQCSNSYYLITFHLEMLPSVSLCKLNCSALSSCLSWSFPTLAYFFNPGIDERFWCFTKANFNLCSLKPMLLKFQLDSFVLLFFFLTETLDLYINTYTYLKSSVEWITNKNWPTTDELKWSTNKIIFICTYSCVSILTILS